MRVFSIPVLCYSEKVTSKMIAFYVNASSKYDQIGVSKNKFDMATNVIPKVK